MLVVSFLEATFTLTVMWCGYSSGVGMIQNLNLFHRIVRRLKLDCIERN